MRYQFTWKNEEGGIRQFSTSAPDIAEKFMRSSSDFPKTTAKIKEQFDMLYPTRGSLEKLLREAVGSPIAEIQTGIKGLTVQYNEGEHLQ